MNLPPGNNDRNTAINCIDLLNKTHFERMRRLILAHAY